MIVMNGIHVVENVIIIKILHLKMVWESSEYFVKYQS
jgi:hypothetical protein